MAGKKHQRLRASNLSIDEEVLFHISRFLMYDFGVQGRKPILFDDKHRLKFICNGIHTLILNRMFGEMDNWVGEDISIRCEVVFYRGGRMRGLRVIEL